LGVRGQAGAGIRKFAIGRNMRDRVLPLETATDAVALYVRTPKRAVDYPAIDEIVAGNVGLAPQARACHDTPETAVLVSRDLPQRFELDISRANGGRSAEERVLVEAGVTSDAVQLHRAEIVADADFAKAEAAVAAAMIVTAPVAT